jgi:protein-disulfide isomerase
MKTIFKRTAVMIVAVIMGVVTATFGVTKESEASIDFFLGKDKSAVTVYFISDWFCPACRELEPRIEQIYAHVSKEARVAFIDYPIHAETNNFTPYNLQFLAFEKEKYPKLRAALAALAKKTKTPTPEQVQAAVSPLGVTLRQMNYADILFGLQSNLTTYRGFGVKATPSVVVENTKTRKHKILVGDKQITLLAIKASLAEISK